MAGSLAMFAPIIGKVSIFPPNRAILARLQSVPYRNAKHIEAPVYYNNGVLVKRTS
jgi:hypothetical protein